MTSQALSSIGNVLALFLAARVGNTEDFGRVALAMAVYAVVLASTRSLLSEPLTIRHQGDLVALRERNAQTAGLLLAAVTGATIIAVALTSGTSTDNAPLLWLGACLPLLIWLDIQRYQWFAVGHPGRSAWLDASWVVLLLVALTVQSDVDSTSVWASWCVAGAATGLAALLIARGPGRINRSLRWVWSHADLGVRLLVETASTVLAVNLAQIGFIGFAGPEEIGAIRGGIALFGPLTILYLGLYPVLVGRAQRSREAMVHLATATTLGMVISAGVLTIVFALLPASIGQEILGDTWHATRQIIWLIGLAMAASVASTGALLGLRALAAADASMRMRLVTAVPTFVLPVAVGAVFGAAGFAVGLLVATSFATALLWRAFGRRIPRLEWADDATFAGGPS